MNQINPFTEETKFPVTYRFSRFTRGFTLLLALLIVAYSLFFIFSHVNQNSRTFQKVLPFIILFFAIDSVSRNLFSINKITLFEEKVGFFFIGKKNIFIPWLNLKKMEVYTGKQRLFVIHYIENGIDKKFYLSMQFPNMLEIVNRIVYFAPHMELDDFVTSLIIINKNKEN